MLRPTSFRLKNSVNSEKKESVNSVWYSNPASETKNVELGAVSPYSTNGVDSSPNGATTNPQLGNVRLFGKTPEIKDKNEKAKMKTDNKGGLFSRKVRLSQTKQTKSDPNSKEKKIDSKDDTGKTIEHSGKTIDNTIGKVLIGDAPGKKKKKVLKFTKLGGSTSKAKKKAKESVNIIKNGGMKESKESIESIERMDSKDRIGSADNSTSNTPNSLTRTSTTLNNLTAKKSSTQKKSSSQNQKVSLKLKKKKKKKKSVDDSSDPSHVVFPSDHERISSNSKKSSSQNSQNASNSTPDSKPRKHMRITLKRSNGSKRREPGSPSRDSKKHTRGDNTKGVQSDIELSELSDGGRRKSTSFEKESKRIRKNNSFGRNSSSGDSYDPFDESLQRVKSNNKPKKAQRR